MNELFDVAIVGGGLVGATMALSLAALDARIALIDATREHELLSERYLALSDSSICLLKHIGVWSFLHDVATPIKQIHVSKKNSFGITRLHAKDLNLDALGYVIPASQIQKALYQRLKQNPHITLIQPGFLHAVTQDKNKTYLSIRSDDGEYELQSSWVIAADGTHSLIRTLLDIPVNTVDYEQSALVTYTQLKHIKYGKDYVAYERFLEQGAIAMLPLRGDCVATIWTDSTKNIQDLIGLNDADFLDALQKSFGYRLGVLQKTYQRTMFPLRMVIAKESRKDRIFLLGNALHTVHPIASQGLNLSLLEISFMTEYFEVWKSFENYQHRPSQFNIELSKQLLTIFGSESFLLNMASSFGLVCLDLLRPLKKHFLQRAIGRVGRVPRLILENEG